MDIDVRVPTTAEPATIYALLLDGSTWPTWSSLDSFEMVRGADGELGAVRLFLTGKHRSYEELVELVPNRRLSYALVAPHNLPFKTYRADVDIAGGTIRWHSQFTMKRAGTAWLTKLLFGRFIKSTAKGLAARAEADAKDLGRSAAA
jgi:hypothetical protein